MTAVPAAIDGLLAVARSWPDLGGSGVRVDDGPWLSRPVEQDVIVIGWLPVEAPTVAWAADPASLDSEAEVFDIHSLVSAWRLDTVLKAARDRADFLLEAMRSAVRSDRTLGGVVATSRLVTLHLTSHQHAAGCSVNIEFAVQSRVF